MHHTLELNAKHYVLRIDLTQRQLPGEQHKGKSAIQWIVLSSEINHKGIFAILNPGKEKGDALAG